jgi:hypothetical protein
MIRRFYLCLLLPMSLAGCADHPPLAEATGAIRPLNAGRWAPTPDDLRGPRAPLPPALSPALNPEAGK